MLLININERSSPQMYIIFAIYPNFTNFTGLNIKLNILIIKMKPQSAIQMYIIYMTSEFCTTILVSIITEFTFLHEIDKIQNRIVPYFISIYTLYRYFHASKMFQER